MDYTLSNRYSEKLGIPLVDQLGLPTREGKLHAQALFGKLVQEINHKLNEGLA